MHVRAISNSILLVILFTSLSSAQLPLAPPSPAPDDRLKTDIMVIVAHEDDYITMIGYLARALYDENKRVAVVIVTSGAGAKNKYGSEEGASLALVLQMEARGALASLGVLDVWFLDAAEVLDNDPLWSLEHFPHGSTLEKTVRLIRLMRPEVVLTWLPDYVVGQNHSDHQATGILATEAFDLAGDPVAYPEQVTPARDYRRVANLTEGLQPWQPQKLYYVTDASHLDFTEGQGPVYSTTDVSPARHVPYYKLLAQEESFFLTQPGVGLPAKKALAQGDLHEYQQPEHFILGKSLVKCSTTGDIFEGVVPSPIPFAPAHGYQPEPREGVSLELGSPWAFYRKFWRAHNIEHIAQILAPEKALWKSGALQVPLLLHNDTDQAQEIDLAVTLPAGWKELEGTARYPVRAHSAYPVRSEYTRPPLSSAQWQVLTWNAVVNGTRVGSVSLRVFADPSGEANWPAAVPRPTGVDLFPIDRER